MNMGFLFFVTTVVAFVVTVIAMIPQDEVMYEDNHCD